MKQLIICGAGGLGREVFTLAKESIGYGKEFLIKGFLDNNANALEGYNNYPPFLGNELTYKPQKEDIFVIAIADQTARLTIKNALMERQASLCTIIHTSAQIADNVSLGNGTVVGRNVVISNDCSLAENVFVNTGAVIGHDTIIASEVVINSGVFLGGAVQVHKAATIFTMAIIAPRLVIGAHAVVGAGSVVVRSIKEGTTVFGNPAKQIL